MGDRPHSALSPVFTALFLLLSTEKCLQNRSIRVSGFGDRVKNRAVRANSLGMIYPTFRGSRGVVFDLSEMVQTMVGQVFCILVPGLSDSGGIFL